MYGEWNVKAMLSNLLCVNFKFTVNLHPGYS